MIALIDYGMGNLGSVAKAFDYIGAPVRLVEKGSDLAAFDAAILPGVGNFGDGMENLQSKGIARAVIDFVKTGKPFLGICLGMQMLADESEEAPGVKGLGIIKGKVIRFPDMGLKIPHMGWNNVSIRRKCPAVEALKDDSFFYFVHSYYIKPDDPSKTVLASNYGIDFTAAVGEGNVFATQFHPEKSQDNGLLLLRNFVKLACGENK